MKTLFKILIIVLMTVLIGLCSAEAQSFKKHKYAKRIEKAQKKHLKLHGEPHGCPILQPIGQYVQYSAKRKQNTVHVRRRSNRNRV